MAEIKVGCCGLPGGLKKYIKDFNVAELQSTFYKPPAKIETAIEWRKIAYPEFEFTIKAWQLITHLPKSPTYKKAGIIIEPEKQDRYGFLRPTKEVFEAWNKMKELADVLKSKITLIQMPASFTCIPENIENAKAFFNSIDRKGIEIAFEPRGDWLEKLEETKKLVNELDLIHCVDIFWDEPQSNHEISYIRLHGLQRRYNYRYVYNEQDMQVLFKKVLDLERAGKKEIYVLFNNVRMRDSALLFKEVLAKKREIE